ncbi:MAG: FAD-dependent thymidylate synthase [Myxococcota bacterium]
MDVPERVSDEGPRVTLRRYFGRPYDGAVAAARTCYSDRVVEAEEVTEGQRRRIGPLTFEGGHHTVYQHASFEFALEGVSRQLLWSFLHRHPFYNSEQQSQRYVVLTRATAHVPPSLGGRDRELYERSLLGAWRAYRDLAQGLEPVLRDRLSRHWNLALRRSRSFHSSIEREIEKRAIEVARYVIPVACHAALVHTISGIVLHRLRRMVEASDVPEEAREVVGRMVACVDRIDPDFFRYVGREPFTEAEIPERQVHPDAAASAEWREAFDAALGKRRSLLVSWTPDAPARVAEAVRGVLGLAPTACSDAEALGRVLDPGCNPYRLDALNVSMHSPLMLTLEHAHYGFRKKLSHSADSQDQRHRMVLGSRPLLSLHDSREPDVVVPELIEATPVLRRRFDTAVGELWEAKNTLVDRGIDLRLAQYLLPNARAIRFQESGSLLHLLHKWTARTCLNAQREIYEASVDEVEQVREVHPELAAGIGPPCVLRSRRVRPRCTEGSHFCGVPVWRMHPDVPRAV